MTRPKDWTRDSLLLDSTLSLVDYEMADWTFHRQKTHASWLEGVKVLPRHTQQSHKPHNLWGRRDLTDFQPTPVMGKLRPGEEKWFSQGHWKSNLWRCYQNPVSWLSSSVILVSRLWGNKYMYIYIHICMYIYIYTYKCVYTYKDTYVF